MKAKKNEVNEESKELETITVTPVPSGKNLPTTAAPEFDDGLGALDSADLIIPRIVVGQAQSQCPDEAKGKFYCEVTGDAKEKIIMVVLKMEKSRVLFPKEFSRDSEPLCRSHNFIVPADDIDNATPMAVTCSECPYSGWSKDEKGKQKAPRCNECWNLLIVDLDDYTPAWFSMKSTALKPARRVMSALKMRAAAKRLPACAFSFEATIGKRTGDSGDSYLPAFSGIKELDDDDRENMMLVRKSLEGESMSNTDYSDMASNPGDDADDNKEDF